MEKQIIYKVIKLLLFLIVLISFFSCSKQPKPNKNYNSYHQIRSTNSYNINSFVNMDSLINNFKKDNCNGINTKLHFVDNKTLKTIYLTVLCENNMTTRCYKEKNVIEIKGDFYIKNNKKKSLDSFSKHFKKDYLNFGKLNYLSKNPNKLWIFIDTKKLDLKIFKKQLSIITQSYDSLNVNYSLNIELRKFIEKGPLPMQK